MKVRLTILFHRLGPYHHARLRAAATLMAVTAVELSAADDTYAWAPVNGADGFRRLTLFHDRDVAHEKTVEVVRRVEAALEESRPEAVAIPGWSDRGALATLRWCGRQGVPVVVMSESTAWDERRVWWKELIKRRVVKLCQAGLVGGSRHVDYLAQLGMQRERIMTGYDVVDNDHFEKGAKAAREQAAKVRQRLGLPERYFLACSRFVAKKNLRRLFQAFAKYVSAAGAGAWKLVLLGDGEERPELERLCIELGLGDYVLMPGFKQYDELPAYYGLAGAFVHASTTEQWGLVVNEAMAAGLPVLVSKRCGCAADLVWQGDNGYTFDPNDGDGLSRYLLKMAGGERYREAMGRASRGIIERWTPGTFAEGLLKAVEMSRSGPRAAAGRVDSALLRMVGR
jgi:glycosyltransferase involved in cell wall biosynthesis